MDDKDVKELIEELKKSNQTTKQRNFLFGLLIGILAAAILIFCVTFYKVTDRWATAFENQQITVSNDYTAPNGPTVTNNNTNTNNTR